MKKIVFLLAALTFCAFAANAQTKKDGTPDMRYRANQQTYGTSTPPPSYSAPSSSSSSGTYYSGSTHTESHGGTYQGTEPGAGSSHKGGSYKNSNTGNQYGHHKRY